MLIFFIWTLIKFTILASIGYFVYEFLKTNKTDKELEILEKDYKKSLEDNGYKNSHPDIELSNRIKGLPKQNQKYLKHQKPVFYFCLKRANSISDLSDFLESLPDEFEVYIPSLIIKSDNLITTNVYVRKYLNQFRLTAIFKTGQVVYTTMGIEELSKKIIDESSEYNMQNIRVERSNSL